MKLSIQFTNKELELIHRSVSFGITHSEDLKESEEMGLLQEKIYALRVINSGITR